MCGSSLCSQWNLDAPVLHRVSENESDEVLLCIILQTRAGSTPRLGRKSYTDSICRRQTNARVDTATIRGVPPGFLNDTRIVAGRGEKTLLQSTNGTTLEGHRLPPHSIRVSSNGRVTAIQWFELGTFCKISRQREAGADCFGTTNLFFVLSAARQPKVISACS